MDSLIHEISKVIIGKKKQIKLVITCFLAESHLLIEDIPGVGKTTLAHAFANVLELDFARIQFTSDMMPGDIIGVNIFNPATGGFEFKKGPIFNSFILADEINRASAKTQSALLEAMSEKTVSIDGTSYKLNETFFVIATKNPMEEHGVYSLPQSELDRFAMSISLGYPDFKSQRAILKKESIDYSTLKKFSLKEIYAVKEKVKRIFLSDEILDAVQNILNFSRESDKFIYGISTRGSLDIINILSAYAVVEGRDYVIPSDISNTLEYIIAHRLEFKEGESSAKEMAKLLISQI
ncbi:MAG: AAA family ATPase [Epsilonproteobacteria bacterium]|nr:MAG: AAA family ATPase [Campylobacterota bacterium]